MAACSESACRSAGRPRHRRWLVVDPHDARPGGTGCTLPCKRAAQSELVYGEAAFWCRHETQSPSRRASASKHETFSQPAHALTHTMPGQAEGTLVARSFRCRCAPRLVGCGAAWPRREFGNEGRAQTLGSAAGHRRYYDDDDTRVRLRSRRPPQQWFSLCAVWA